MKTNFKKDNPLKGQFPYKKDEQQNAKTPFKTG